MVRIFRAGAVPYALGTSDAGNEGQLIYLPASQEITAEHKGKIIIREIPTANDPDPKVANAVAPPYAFLFQFAKYVSSALNDLKKERYDKPFLAGGFMHRD